MYLEILSPESSMFNGEVDGVQLPGVDGLFEVLDRHAPLIAALGEGDIRIKAGSDIFRYHVKSGFVEVLNNNIAVLVEGGEKIS